MAAYYLAVDIGASSGRHILGHMENGKMVLEEIYRFENGMVKKDGELCWEFDRLFKEVVNGLKKCKEIGKIPVSMGVDTWGVDFVLLDKDDKVLGNTVGYRDHRTEGMDKEVYKAISLKDLYARTGIQKADYNTIYQLMAVKKKHPEYLEQAETLLHVPDYFHFLLTGQKTCEYTEATTGQLVSPITKDWDYELIDMLGYPRKMFQKLIMPGTGIGHLSDKITEKLGVLGGYILSAGFLPLVSVGLHQALTPIHAMLNDPDGATKGINYLLPILMMAGGGQVGAGLALYFKTKNAKLKKYVAESIPVGILGVGEPLMYAVTLPLVRPFVTACLGAGFGGALAALLHIGTVSQGVSGLFGLLIVVPGQQLGYVAAMLLAYAAGFVLTWFFGVDEQKINEFFGE